MIRICHPCNLHDAGACRRAEETLPTGGGSELQKQGKAVEEIAMTTQAPKHPSPAHCWWPSDLLELGIEIILWQVDWCVCRTLTFNRYPGIPTNGQDRASRLSLFLVCSIGFAALVALGIGLALQSG
ncbi:hypothetical protein E8F11_22920 [Pseudomonas sp. BN417]|uniref:hypothetical protein n=1 Tax=Pseudomonas sp. BN417 TaxID=2567890 RepID=UPI002457509C|nr:hypothetical protein [Pseudomonas sp. BN417]MDH4557992.1 hypothetical protein [Pseudomonas sp. BN417]